MEIATGGAYGLECTPLQWYTCMYIYIPVYMYTYIYIYIYFVMHLKVWPLVSCYKPRMLTFFSEKLLSSRAGL